MVETVYPSFPHMWIHYTNYSLCVIPLKYQHLIPSSLPLKPQCLVQSNFNHRLNVLVDYMFGYRVLFRRLFTYFSAVTALNRCAYRTVNVSIQINHVLFDIHWFTSDPNTQHILCDYWYLQANRKMVPAGHYAKDKIYHRVIYTCSRRKNERTLNTFIFFPI